MRQHLVGRKRWSEGSFPELVERSAPTKAPGIIGIDFSLTRTAAVYLPPRWDPREPWQGIEWIVIEPRQPDVDLGPGHAQAIRLGVIADQIFFFVTKCKVKHVACEDHAFSRNLARAKMNAEVHGAVKKDLWARASVVVRPFVASNARKTFVGPVKGPPGTQKIVVHEKIRALDPPWTQTSAKGKVEVPADEGDAFVIANHARSVLGLPCVVVA